MVKLIDRIREKRRKKAEAEREYASKQASVDTEISKTATGTNAGGRSTQRSVASKQASVDTEIGKTATDTNTGGRSAQRSVATGGSPKDDLRIKRKNYSSMYSGAGRNIV